MRRSMLFVPGNTPKMMTSCGFFGADAVIFDLEDAVSPTEKDAARDLVRYAIGNLYLCGSEVIVRVNSIETPMFLADLAAVVPQKPDLIMLPKTCTAEDIQMLAQTLDRLEAGNGLPAGAVGILALIETALGVENAFSIASASPRVQALFLGAEDLSADLHCKRTKEGTEILYARTRLVMAARAAGIDVYDTPFTDVDDDEGLCADAALAKSLGFTGKAIALRPKQREAEADRPRRLRCELHAGTQPGTYYFERRGEPADLPEDFSGWIACAPHDGVAHATTAHRTFLRCTRTEDGGVQFPPELLAAGGRCSVYAVDQTGTMRVAEVRLPKPKPAPASTEPQASGQTGDAPAQP